MHPEVMLDGGLVDDIAVVQGAQGEAGNDFLSGR